MSEEISSINYKIEALTSKIGDLTTAIKELRDKIPSTDSGNYWATKSNLASAVSEIKGACSK
jgi:hypothetical protein